MNGRFTLSLLLLGALGFCLRAVQPAEPVPLQTEGPARLFVNVSRQDGLVLVKFSGVFELTIEVEGDRGLDVDPPPIWTVSAGWKIKNVEPHTMKKHGEKQRWRQTFTLDPLTPEPAPVELKSLRYRHDEGPWHILDKWKPIVVKVITQVKDADLNSVREHADIEELPPAPTGHDWSWPSVAIPAGCLGLVLLVILLRRRAIRLARNKPWEEIALYELNRLTMLELPERGRTGEFHTLLANVIRRYLERRYDLPARRLTTQEFSSLLEQTPLLTAAQKKFLATFLWQCDLAKFAVANASEEECAELCRQTREFLDTAAMPSRKNVSK